MCPSPALVMESEINWEINSRMSNRMSSYVKREGSMLYMYMMKLHIRSSFETLAIRKSFICHLYDSNDAIDVRKLQMIPLHVTSCVIQA